MVGQDKRVINNIHPRGLTLGEGALRENVAPRTRFSVSAAPLVLDHRQFFV